MNRLKSRSIIRVRKICATLTDVHQLFWGYSYILHYCTLVVISRIEKWTTFKKFIHFNLILNFILGE